MYDVERMIVLLERMSNEPSGRIMLIRNLDMSYNQELKFGNSSNCNTFKPT